MAAPSGSPRRSASRSWIAAWPAGLFTAPRYAARMDLAHLADELVAALRAQLPDDVILEGFEVELGEHVGVDAEALRAALQLRVPGVDVQILNVEGLLRCLDCGAEYPADEAPCPVCGSARSEHAHGQELSVRRAWARPRP